MPYGGSGMISPGVLATMGAVVDHGYIAVPSDFPLPGVVLNAWFYQVTVDVTDNDPTRTNTGQSFLAGDDIMWKAASHSWEIIGRATAPLADTYKADVIPDGDKDGINDTFTLPGGHSYVPTSIEVYLNGVSYNPESIFRMGPGYTQFRIDADTLPNTLLGDTLTCSYVKPA